MQRNRREWEEEPLHLGHTNKQRNKFTSVLTLRTLWCQRRHLDGFYKIGCVFLLIASRDFNIEE